MRDSVGSPHFGPAGIGSLVEFRQTQPIMCRFHRWPAYPRTTDVLALQCGALPEEDDVFDEGFKALACSLPDLPGALTVLSLGGSLSCLTTEGDWELTLGRLLASLRRLPLSICQNMVNC